MNRFDPVARSLRRELINEMSLAASQATAQEKADK